MSKQNPDKYTVAGPDYAEYVICPYNELHRVLPYRLSNHLVRCARSHQGSKMIHCPFNTTHVYTPKEMALHVKDCPNRDILEKFKTPDKLPPQPTGAEFQIESTEDWDADPPSETYNPRAHCNKVFVVRNPQGYPPSVRRQFRERERRRFIENDQ
ncbi:hypothetical protein KR018_001817 [Drosophila ironensis]|nr:hypothetical protein KR018_001817 [Drosophila ironensis]